MPVMSPLAIWGKLTFISTPSAQGTETRRRTTSAPCFSAEAPGDLLPVAQLAHGDGADAEQGGFHRRGDRPGIGDILAHIAAAVDAGKHEIGPPLAEQMVDGDEHAIRRRPVDGEALLPDAAYLQRTADRQGMPRPALLHLRRHDPDIARELARDPLDDLQPRRVDAVVIGDEDAGVLEIERGFTHRP